MSLLMEALRKAEEAKRRGQEQQSPPSPQGSGIAAPANEPSGSAPAFTLEHREIHIPTPDAAVHEPEETPETVPEQTSARVPQTAPFHRDELQDYLTTTSDLDDSSPPRRRTARGSEPTRDQLAAASVFAAKQNSGKRKTYVKILLGSLALILPVIGGTLWYLSDFPASSLTVDPTIASYDLSSKGFLDEQAPPAAATETPVAADAAETAAELDAYAENILALESGAELAAPVAELAEPAAALESLPETAVITDATGTGAIPAAAPETFAEFADAGTAIASPTDPAAIIDTPPARLQISRSSGRTQVNSTLQSAYNTLQAGDYQTAALLYQEALTELPNSRDALLGLATIHIRQNEASQARQLYARILTLNPQDPYARTGLLQTMQSGPGTTQETELKSLLTQYPELAPLHFTLGNLYAAQQRWSEAQTAYFNALVYAGKNPTGPISPDYAFNLAVSLEQLQQPKAALDYYRQAQELALRSPPGFDQRLLQSRLDYLLLMLEQNQP